MTMVILGMVMKRVIARLGAQTLCDVCHKFVIQGLEPPAFCPENDVLFVLLPDNFDNMSAIYVSDGNDKHLKHK